MKNINWIIIDCRNGKALYGAGRRTLKLSTEAIANEVGRQFFEYREDFIVFDTSDLVKCINKPKILNYG